MKSSVKKIKGLPVRVQREALNIAGVLFSMNSPGASRYEFDHDGKTITYGEFMYASEGAEYDWSLSLASGMFSRNNP